MKREAQILKALADESRLRILQLLVGGELCVCELMAVLGLPQSTVSRHLSYLRNSGWLQDRREGVWMYYRIDDEMNELAGSLFPVLAEQLSRTRQGAADRLALEKYQQEQARKTCNE